jgi:competence protein ComEC
VKRPILAFAFAGILGIVFALGRIGIDTLVLLLILTVLLIFTTFKDQKINIKLLSILVFTFLIFFIRMRLVSNKFDAYDMKIAQFQQMNVKIEGYLESEGYSENSHYYILRNSTISTAYGTFEELSSDNQKKYAHRYNQNIGKVKVYEKKDDTVYGPVFSSLLRPGNKLSFIASIMDSDYPTNDGEFDFKTYNRSKNISGNFFSKEDVKVIDSKYDAVLYFINKIKAAIIYQIFTIYNFEDAGILSTMLTGDRANLLSSIKKLFNDSGVSHILAISGLHLSILGLGLFEILRKKLSVSVSAVITTIFIIFYGVMIDASATSIRAIFMLLLRFISLSIGKTYDTASSLATCALVLLIFNPYILFNAGFQFSFVAIYSLTLYEGQDKNPNMKDVIISSIILQLFILPVTIFHYFKYPIYSILLNLIVIPLMTYVLCIGILSIIMSFVFMPGGYFLAGSVHYIFTFYKLLMNFELSLPFARLTLGRPSLNQIAIYYIILLVLFRKDILKFLYVSKDVNSIKGKGKERLIVINTLFLAIFASLLILLIKPKHNLQVNYLNIGQGDSIVINSNELLITIDGGSTSNKSNGEYILEPFILQGARDVIDMAFITHADSDHTNGIKFLLSDESEVVIKKLILPISALKDDRYNELRNLSSNKNTEVMYLKAGDSISFGDKKITCLYPMNDAHIDDPNKHSLILLLNKGKDDKFLFMGDAGVAEEMAAIENSKKLNIDIAGSILKLGHHGSSTSSSEEFIDFVSPSAVVLSYGKNNSYGHPHKEVVQLINKKNLKTYSTAVKGQITIEK